MVERPEDMSADVSEDRSGIDVFQSLRVQNPVSYFSAQFVPAEKRRDVLILALFDDEVRKIVGSVREPMAGEIRLQWWREVSQGQRRDEASASPVASYFQALIDRHQIQPGMLEPYFDGRIFDLYADAVEDKAAFEAYAGQTHGALLQLSNFLLDRDNMMAGAELSGYLACVEALLNRVVFPARRGSVGAMRYLPPETRAMVGDDNPFLDGCQIRPDKLADKAVELAEHYLEDARKAASSVPVTLHGTYARFAPLVTALRKGETPETVPAYKLIWRLWRGTRPWPCF